MLSINSFKNKHNVYYVDGNVVKSFEDLQKAVDNRELVEKLDKKSGQRRYFDYNQKKWLRK